MWSLLRMNRSWLIPQMLSLLYFISFSSNVNGHLYDIVRIDVNWTGGPRVSSNQLFRYVTGGLSQAFWQYVNSSDFDSLHSLSSSCKQSLQVVRNGLDASSTTAFKFVDSGGKSPPGFMAGTVTSLGDFDQCLSIDDFQDDLRLQGKYCAIDTYPLKNRPVNASTFSLDQVSVFDNFPFINSICLPSQCKTDEARLLFSLVVSSLGFKATGDINCETKDTVTFLHAFTSLNSTQMLSGLFVLLMVAIVLTFTFLHLAVRMNCLEMPPVFLSTMESVSVITSTRNLFTAPPYTRKSMVVDCIKVLVIWDSILGHAISCLESPLGFGVLDKHHTLNWIVTRPYSELYTNVVQLVAVTVVSGFCFGQIAYPIARNSRFPVLFAILDKYTRFLCPIMAMTACELLWPLTGNGPLWSRVANFVTDKCTRNWWRNLLFVNNLGTISSIDICGGSSFYMSIDMHLFILGCLMMFLFSLNGRVAWLFALVSSVLSMLYLAFNVIKHQVQDTILTQLVPIKIMDYLDYVHMTTVSYIPAYMIGIVVGYLLLEDKFIVTIKSWRDFAVGFFYNFTLLLSTFFIPMLPRLFTLEGWSMPLVIISARVVTAYAWASVIVFFMGFKLINPFLTRNKVIDRASSTESESTHRIRTDCNNKTIAHPQSDEAPIHQDPSINIFKGLTRLTLPLFLVNYLVIRTMFFSQRAHYQLTFMALLSRFFTGFILSHLAAYMFQVIFLSPLEVARKAIFYRTIKIEQKAQ